MGKNGALNTRQQKFVEEFLRLGNAPEAYKRAGYKGTGKAANVTAYQLLAHPTIKAIVQEHREHANREAGITLAMIIRKLGDIAFADIKEEVRLSHVLKANAELVKCLALESFERRLAALERALGEQHGDGNP
jgi:phage terminase small subunit